MGAIRSPYLAGVDRLEEVAGGGKPLRLEERSTGVAMLQAALRDLDYPLLKSTDPVTIFDGYFGAETEQVLKQFQRERHLDPDGVADQRTMAVLDLALLSRLPKPLPRFGAAPSWARPQKRGGGSQPTLPVSAQLAPTKPSGPPPIPPPGPHPHHYADLNYKIGRGDPIVTPDAGAGAWNSTPKAWTTRAQAAAVQAVLRGPSNTYPGPNATRHLRHYFDNTGLPLNVNLEDMVRNVPSAGKAMVAEFRQVQAFLSHLPPGRYDFTSQQAEGGYDTKGENADWFFATGGYSYWGKGRAQINMVHGQKHYDVEFTYKFYDRYNWDFGKQTTIGPITISDDFMGEFHREGLAKEFDCHGMIKRRLSWAGNYGPPDSAIIGRPGF